MKRIIVLLIISTLGIAFIIGILIIKETKVQDTSTTNNIEKIDDIIVKSFEHPHNEYFPEDKITASATISNSTKEDRTVWMQLKVKDKLGRLVYSNSEKQILMPENVITYTVSWIIPQNIKSGSYKTEVIVWNNDPSKPETTKIAESIDLEQFTCFKEQENFDSLDKDIWEVSEKNLGRTNFKSENVSTEGGMLKIDMPRKTFEGGEIFTKKLQSAGAYEIRMKLPLAPTSITGFFMYKSPDYYYEIDIELYNESAGTLLFTTYSDGEKNNEYVGKVDFDPNKEFHNYRFEYDENSVEFYVDNKLIKGFRDGFPKEDMYLMLNSWYPNWLDGQKQKENQYLLVDWIKY